MKKSSLAVAGALALSAVLASAAPAAASVTPEWTTTPTSANVSGAYGRGDLDFDSNNAILTMATTDTASDGYSARLYVRFGLATGGTSSPYSVSASGSGVYKEKVITYPRTNLSNGVDVVQVKECLTQAGGDVQCGSWANAAWL